jgi:hypothetical protein
MKKRTGMWRRVAAGVLTVGLLLGAWVTPALADTSAETAALANNTPVSGMLTGNESGGFVYYQIEYPGGKAALTVDASFSADVSVGDMIGFHVYGPNGYTGTGVWQDDTSTYEVSYARDDAATLTVQLYNYTIDTTSYTLVANGVAEATEEEAATTEAATPAATTDESTGPNLAAGASGTVVGNAGGAYGLYVIPSDGSGTDLTVTMTFTPDDASYLHAFGLIVYDPDGNAVTRGSQPTGVLGTYQGTFSADADGNYTVQVYNYADNVPLNYTLSVAQ